MMRSKKKKSSRPTLVTPPEEETPEGKIERLEREIARLQRVNAQLEMDVEILGRAAAFAKRDE
jgi:hypothetical protein